MNLLLLTLPPGAPGSYEYATSVDGQTLAAHGSAGAALLPPARRGVEVVAMVPAALLSWQRVTLPRGVGSGSPRLRAVLTGLLEDRLLDEPEQLHFALDPEAVAGGAAWVAVCDKGWLTAHLHALDAAERPVARIVPELYPRAGVLRLTVTGQPQRPWVLMSGDAAPGGVQALPLTPDALALLHTAPDGDAAVEVELLAEPAVAALAEQVFNRRVTIQQPAQRLLAVSRSPWDLAQFDLARTGTARAAKRLGALWRDFLHAPLWRPARWGIAGLLLVNLIGLNIWAWQTRQELVARRAQINATLTQTFPQVKVVEEAQTQMAREIAALRQSTGASSARDLEQMLSAIGEYVPVAPSAMDFTPGELRLKGAPLAASALAEANQRLRPHGYQLTAEADALLLRQEMTP
ncbi:MAG: general secretion pathway protein GspL [Burkholderiaceae bacterium]|jgi:general secretion pathway protein L|nr:general secretion pathway protein GspL [Burkholderiaceae bacterium]